MINNVAFQKHTDLSKLVKCADMVHYRTAQIMFRARNNSLPGNIQKLFCVKEGAYQLSGKLNFKIQRE